MSGGMPTTWLGAGEATVWIVGAIVACYLLYGFLVYLTEPGGR